MPTRIPSAADAGAKTFRVVSGPGAVRVAPAAAGYASLGSPVAVGLTDGGVELTPQFELLELEDDQLYGNHGIVETKFGFTVGFSMSQVDIWNINLAFGYDQAAVASTTIDDFSFTQDEPSPYHGLDIITEGGRDTAADSAVKHIYEFFKVKVVPNGATTFTRQGKHVLPVIAHCLINDSGIFGRVYNDSLIVKPEYE